MLFLYVTISYFIAFCSVVAVPQKSVNNSIYLKNSDGSWKSLREIAPHIVDVNLPLTKDGNTPLHSAVEKGSLEIVELLLHNSANPNKTNEYGNTALHLAALKGYEKIANLLLENGADINASNKFGESVLHYAANSGDDVIVDFLIQNGVNLNVMNEYGDTAIHFAARSGHAKIISLLAHNGVNYNTANKNGNTPLHLASGNGEVEAVKTLLQNNADPNIQNKLRKTARDIAIERGHENVVNLFKSITTAERACSIYSSLPIPKILNGFDVTEDEFPWMVSLGYLNDDDKIVYECGGTIISDFYILTAAHCITDRKRPIRVRLGTIMLTNDAPDINLRTYNHPIEVTYFIFRLSDSDSEFEFLYSSEHPGYTNFAKKHDIALIRVARKMIFSEFLRPACLYTSLNDVNQSERLIISGWGLTSLKGDRPDRLLKAYVNTVPLSECNATMLEYNNKVTDTAAYRNGISDGQYCARDLNGHSDSCQGDSGGPLQILPAGSDTVKVVGIVSFGMTCGFPYPSIYTRVAYYLDWIESIVWPDGINSTIPIYHRRILKP